MAARLGDTDLALRYFHETAATDLADTPGGSAGGVHIAPLGGLWQAVLFGFAGLSFPQDALAFDPQLPAGWRSLAFRVRWHDHLLKIRIEQAERRLDATLETGERMRLIVSGDRHELRGDQPLQLR